MTNRVGGDFSPETLEVFRALYAQKEVKPEDLEIDGYTGLPTSNITNVSPWIEHTGLWKANPGTQRDFVPNTPLPGSIESAPEDQKGFDNLSSEEYDALVEDVISEFEKEEAFANMIYNSDDENDEGDENYQDDQDDQESDEELERLIQSILDSDNDDGNDENDDNDEDGQGGEMTDEELDSLIDSLFDTEEESEDDGEEGELGGDLGYTDDELEDLIKGLSDDEDNDEGQVEVSEPEEGEVPYTEDDTEDQEEEMSEDEIDKLIDEIMNDPLEDAPEGTPDDAYGDLDEEQQV